MVTNGGLSDKLNLSNFKEFAVLGKGLESNVIVLIT